MRRRDPALVGLGVLLCVASTQAQTRGHRPEPRFEISAGGGWFSGTHFDSRDVDLRANMPAPTPYRLFTMDTRISAAPTVHAQLAIGLTRRISFEARVTKSHPELRAGVSADAEGAPPVAIVERIDRYMVEGGVIVLFDQIRAGRMTPFATAGAGYLRELHEGQMVVEQGHLYYTGGGLTLRVLSRSHGWIRTAGIRVDGRVYLLSGGVAPDAHPRAYGALSGGIFVGL